MGTDRRPAQRGPRAQRGQIAERILVTARDGFATEGYAATTLHGVARAAGVDTKLVRYYFGNKQALLEACLSGPEQLVERVRHAMDVPLPRRGETAVRVLLAAWTDPELARILRTSLLIAAHEPVAMSRVRAVFSEGLIPAITKDLDPAEISTRGGLITSQMIGLAFSRFVFALEDAAAIPDTQVVAMVGATIQAYLTNPLTEEAR